MSLIALDYDGTYTADPQLWDSFIAMASGRGHQVVCATMRYDSEPIDVPCEVIYTARQPKMAALAALGILPAIWIDDQPHFLVMPG
jgi:hypothetical protein